MPSRLTLVFKSMICIIHINSNLSKIKLFHILHDLRIVKRPIDIIKHSKLINGNYTKERF